MTMIKKKKKHCHAIFMEKKSHFRLRVGIIIILMFEGSKEMPYIVFLNYQLCIYLLDCEKREVLQRFTLNNYFISTFAVRTQSRQPGQYFRF